MASSSKGSKNAVRSAIVMWLSSKARSRSIKEKNEIVFLFLVRGKIEREKKREGERERPMREKNVFF